MIPDRWVVVGTDKYGDTFEWPHAMDASTQAEAEDTVRRMNKRGGNVRMVREVWSGPKARYVREEC